MPCSAFGELFSRKPSRPARLAPAPLADLAAAWSPAQPHSPVQPVQSLPWSAPRVAVNDQLWGRGFVFPGGEAETLQLAEPFGISTAGSLLLVGVGSGGPASAVVQNFGAWVTGAEADAGLLATAQARVGNDRLGRRVTLDGWDPENPAFNERTYNHCLALEPLRRGQPEPILLALKRAIGPGGQVVISCVASDRPLDADDATATQWASLEDRSLRSVPTVKGLTRMLGRVGFEVRTVEDITRRHIDQALLGWRVLLNRLREAAPDRDIAAPLLREAELWLLRRRLMRAERIRMMSWHAISRRPTVRPA